MTVALALAEPPAPVQVIEYVFVAVSEPVLCVPEVASEPLHAPEPVHELAFVLDHDSVELPPYETDVGLADSVTVGAGAEPTVTVAFAVAEPPVPVQVIE